jgi:hypothetical protein
MIHAIRKTISPWNWWVIARDLPRTPKVNLRFAAVFPTAVISSARKLAANPDMMPEKSRYSRAYAAVDSSPTARKRTT